MKIISTVGAKGGTGKSSVALLLAWELCGKSKVALFDSDIQGTCVSAKALNSALPFDVVSIGDKGQLHSKGQEYFKSGYDYLIIDGNPRSIHEDPAMIELIAKLSDLNLIVSRPCPRDLKAQIKYVEKLKMHTIGEIRLLWNFFQKYTTAHQEGIVQGEKLLGLKSLKNCIGLRIAYQDIGYTEDCISKLGNKTATEEVKKLTDEVKKVLHGKD